jgi:hypothetical protein
LEPEAGFVLCRQAPEREVTSAPDELEQSSFGRDEASHGGVVDLGKGADSGVLRSHLDGEGALPWGRQHDLGLQLDAFEILEGEPEAAHSSGGEENSVEIPIAELANACRNVATQSANPDLGTCRERLSSTTK